MSWDYCSWPEFFSEKHDVKARKEHFCVECHEKIKMGEIHYVYSGKWEGEFSSGRQHTDCLNACVYIRDQLQRGECIPFGALMDWCSEVDYTVDEMRLWPKGLRRAMAKYKWETRR